jgi:hypothetical protein
MPKRGDNLTEQAIELLLEATRRRGHPKLSAFGVSLIPKLRRLIEEEEAEYFADENGSGKGKRPGDESGAPVGSDKPPEPGTEDETTDGPHGGEDGGQTGEGACCREIVARLERIKIVRLTTPSTLKDQVVVTALTKGEVMDVTPLPFLWPIDRDGDPGELDMDVNNECTETPLFARVRPGLGCRFSLATEVVFWERDFGDLAAFIRRAATDLAVKLAASQGIVLPDAGRDIISTVVRELLNALGLDDERMGSYNFSLSGELNSATPIEKLSWDPAWGQTYKHVRINQHMARLKQTFKRFGGEWETSITVQRIC